MKLKELKKALNKFPDKDYGDYEVVAMVNEHSNKRFSHIANIPLPQPEEPFSTAKRIAFDLTHNNP